MKETTVMEASYLQVDDPSWFLHGHPTACQVRVLLAEHPQEGKTLPCHP